jgi:hypothetical protein
MSVTKVASGCYCLLLAQAVQIEFEVLRHEFSQHQIPDSKPHCQHPLSQVWRQFASSSHYPFGVVSRGHLAARCGGFGGFLQVDETIASIIFLADT